MFTKKDFCKVMNCLKKPIVKNKISVETVLYGENVEKEPKMQLKMNKSADIKVIHLAIGFVVMILMLNIAMKHILKKRSDTCVD